MTGAGKYRNGAAHVARGLNLGYWFHLMKRGEERIVCANYDEPGSKLRDIKLCPNQSASQLI